MATPKQIAANRQNSLRSTGPRTGAGKKVSSQNALKLGLYSKALLPNESSDELRPLSRRIRDDLAPVGAMEECLVDAIVVTLFRLRRLVNVEAGLYEMYSQYKGLDGGVSVAFAHDQSQLGCLPKVAQCEAALNRQLYRALEELRRLQRDRPKTALVPVEVERVVAPAEQSATVDVQPTAPQRPGMFSLLRFGRNFL